MDKILGTNLHLWRFFSRYTCLTPPTTPPPPYNVGHVYTLFLQSFNIVLGGGGRKQRILTRIRVLFWKFRFKNTGINAITQVSQGILSTIVACHQLKYSEQAGTELLPLLVMPVPFLFLPPSFLASQGKIVCWRPMPDKFNKAVRLVSYQSSNMFVQWDLNCTNMRLLQENVEQSWAQIMKWTTYSR